MARRAVGGGRGECSSPETEPAKKIQREVTPDKRARATYDRGGRVPTLLPQFSKKKSKKSEGFFLFLPLCVAGMRRHHGDVEFSVSIDTCIIINR